MPVAGNASTTTSKRPRVWASDVALTNQIKRRNEQRDRTAVTGDDESLARSDLIDNPAEMTAQFGNSDPRKRQISHGEPPSSRFHGQP